VRRHLGGHERPKARPEHVVCIFEKARHIFTL